MSTLAIIVGCIAFMLVAGIVRGNPGRGIGDTTILVMLLAFVALIELVLGQFTDIGDAAKNRRDRCCASASRSTRFTA